MFHISTFPSGTITLRNDLTSLHIYNKLDICTNTHQNTCNEPVRCFICQTPNANASALV